MDKLKTVGIRALVGIGAVVAGLSGRIGKKGIDITNINPYKMVIALGVLSAVWLVWQVPALVKKAG